MRRPLASVYRFVLVAGFSCLACGGRSTDQVSTSDSDVAAAVSEAKQRSRDMQAQLKQALLEAIEAEGPAAAIGVCKTVAPKLAADASSEGWTLRRTALRVRNPDNVASEWQRAVLEDFVRQQEAGVDPSTLSWHEVVEQDGRATLRYMQAIPMAGLCLGCHGSPEQITPEVQAKLAELYPADQATGFSVGEVRGAFVVTGPLGR